MQGVGAEHADSPWNLGSFLQLRGNVLRHAAAGVASASQPHLAVGMMFSSTPWRLAPHLQYTASYLHTGAPKKWCAIGFCRFYGCACTAS